MLLRYVYACDFVKRKEWTNVMLYVHTSYKENEREKHETFFRERNMSMFGIKKSLKKAFLR